MIILGKVFNKDSDKEGQLDSRVRIFAIYKDDKFVKIESNEQMLKEFPNNGKIYVPRKIEVEQFGMYHLSESPTYSANWIHSSKYTLSSVAFKGRFFEVIDIFYDMETANEQIAAILRRGIKLGYKPHDDILIRTKDHYIIGPIKITETNHGYGVKNEQMIPYYRMKVQDITISDEYEGQKRIFTVQAFTDLEPLGKLDLLDEVEVIRYVLNKVKNYADLVALSRKVMKQMVNWLASDSLEEIYVKQRFERTLESIEKKMLYEDFVETYTKELLKLDQTKIMIEQQVEERFEKEYKRFVKENIALLAEHKENQKLQKVFALKLQEIQKKVALNEIVLQKVEEEFKQKIKNLQENFALEYAKLLADFPLHEPASNKVMIPGSVANVLYSSVHHSTNALFYDFYSEFSDKIKFNLKCLTNKDRNQLLATVILATIKLEQPIVIVGKYALELAQILVKTIAAEETISLIAEMDTLTLSAIEQQFERFSNEESVKVLALHNLNYSTVQYSFPLFIQQCKWLGYRKTPDLFILTFENEVAARELINRLPNAPVIDATQFLNEPLKKLEINKLIVGQLTLQNIEDFVVLNEERGLTRRFEEWYYNQGTVAEDIEVSSELEEWLQCFVGILEENEGFIIFEKVFSHALNRGAKISHEYARS